MELLNGACSDFGGAARLCVAYQDARLGPQARRYSLRLGFLGPLGSAPMSGIIARVLVVLFGVSFGFGLICEMILRHRKVRSARRHLRTTDSGTQ
jgi:hypothetical protein